MILRKIHLLFLSFILSMSVSAESSLTQNQHYVNEMKFMDSFIQISHPTLNIRPANKFTGLEVGFSPSAFKLLASTITEVNSWLTYGFGFGVRYYHQMEKLIVPLFALIQFNIPLNGNVSPFIAMKSGYSFNGGYLFNPELGISIKTQKKRYFIIGLGYEFFQVNHNYYERFDDNNAGITFGLRF